MNRHEPDCTCNRPGGDVGRCDCGYTARTAARPVRTVDLLALTPPVRLQLMSDGTVRWKNGE